MPSAASPGLSKAGVQPQVRESAVILHTNSGLLTTAGVATVAYIAVLTCLAFSCYTETQSRQDPGKMHRRLQTS